MRGRRQADLRSEGKQLAEQMGYHWAENTDVSMKFDGLMYRANRIVAVTLIKCRYGLDTDCIIDKKFPEKVADLLALPLPRSVLRELWVRTQNERAFRRFWIAPDMTAEIEENTIENYHNTHFREEYWKRAPYRVEIALQKNDPEKG